jgi:hypothetical protein
MVHDIVLAIFKAPALAQDLGSVIALCAFLLLVVWAAWQLWSRRR